MRGRMVRLLFAELIFMHKVEAASCHALPRAVSGKAHRTCISPLCTESSAANRRERVFRITGYEARVLSRSRISRAMLLSSVLRSCQSG